MNGLGPTEATVSLQYFIDKQTDLSTQRVPLGYPVEDTEILLLNEAGKPADIRGEIAIRCEHVALGYWRKANATESAFTSDSQDPGARIYRTGDIGRRLPDGSIVFEGRKDFQIKIRGFRVELGEVEMALSEHPAVCENVVVAGENELGEKRLLAYVVADKQESPTTSDLRNFLREKLPDHMVPAIFVFLDSLPLTSSGKLDRRALPVPERSGRELKTGSEAPQTPTQQLLAGMWADLLGIKQVHVTDNFFELGGHSLLAVRLFAQIEKRFGKRLPLATLFQAPTLEQLSAILQKDWTPRWSSLVPIQPAGFKPPFFCVHAVGGNVLEFYALAQHLGADQPFYGLQSQGLDGKQFPHTA